MSLTRKASSAAKKPAKPPRHDLAAALAEREAELADARSQQAATSEILRVISRSKTDPAPVFETILQACQRLFGSDEIGVYTIGDDEMVRVAAWLGPRAEEVRRDVTPLAESVTGRIIRERRTHHIPDLRVEPNLSALVRERVERLGSASLLYAPMLWEDRGLGSILVARSPPRPFSDREQTLLQSFADQAAIAIENARLFRETNEALERQTATADILKVIARSPTDVQPVFEAIATSANKLIGSFSTAVLRFVDGAIHLAAFTPTNPRADEVLRTSFPRQLAEFPPFLLVRDGETIQFADTEADHVPSLNRQLARLRGYRSMLFAPLMSQSVAIGMISVTRREPGVFAAHQVQLLQTFADQAVIAIENARLFDEVQARTRDLEESLQQQTATAEVLKVISRSAFDLQAVLDTLVASAAKLCGADQAGVFTRRGDLYHWAANYGFSPEMLEYAQAHPFGAGLGSTTGRAALEGRTIHNPDVLADPHYTAHEHQRLGGYRTNLGVPLLRGGAPMGVFTLTRQQVRPFTERQIELVETFADQAVIAIENARLFDDVQARTRDLEASLEQQTATADVLKAISRSAFDLETVLESLISTAMRLCNAKQGVIFRRHGDIYRYAASHMLLDPAYRAHEQTAEIKAGRGTLIGRVALENRTVQIEDAWGDPDYAEKDEIRRTKVRSMLDVPLLRNGEPIGAFGLGREEPVPFTQRQIDLVTTFADQAVIAIENVRLFDEVQAKTRDLEESLQQQTATADVLKVISRSAFDLDAVFDALLASAVSLIGSRGGTICVREGDGFRYRAVAEGRDSAMWRYLSEHPPTPGRASLAGRILLSGKPEIIIDSLLDSDLKVPVQALAGTRSVVGVPLLRDNKVEGALMVGRAESGPFDSRQIELLQTFADQAVIAIENVRLFDEVQARTRDLEEALAQQTATADVLKVISRSVSDAAPVFESILESCQRLLGLELVAVYLVEGKMVRGVARRGWTLGEWGRDDTPLGGSSTGLAIAERRAIHFPDLVDKPDLPDRWKAILKESGGLTVLYAPMLLEDRGVGSIVVARRPARPFSEKEIALAQSFADQAVIAIQNARLFDEVQARTRDLTEALQQQTATAEVLKVISRSAFDLQAVLDTLTSSAVELSGASNGVIALREGDGYRYRAFSASMTPEFVQYLVEHPPVPGPGSGAGLAIRSRRIEQIPDVIEDPDYELPMPSLNRTRSILAVPLLRDDRIEGAFVVTGAEPGMFPQRQIDLIQTFADQAVIALENVRLFDEVQARTRDLTEALQMQTATSDVLKVISRSAFDLQAVFNTLVTSAVELGGALTGTICVRDGDVFRYRDTIGAEHTSALAQYLRDHPATPGRSTIAGRVLLSGKVERIPDCLADPEYVVPMGSLATNVRSLLGVPLLRKEGVEGAIILTRAEPGEFTDRQIEIVQTFADQAVIALQNVRLFDEVQARTRELAASLDDLRKAQDRLIQSEKLASLGQLTAGIAHEIKNPLNFVNNFSALSRELVGELADVIKAAPLDDARREEADELIETIGGNLDKVVSHGKRADSIVKNMLLHSREGSGERSTTNVNAMVEEALNLAYHGARAEKPGFNVTIVRSLDPNAGEAEVYAQEMTRVLLNLISNGLYATAKRKSASGDGAYEPTITASTRDLGHSVEIAIRDNGTGIPDEVKAKMFNPFFTTKPAGEGTGLGLSLSHDIVVKQHGGTIEVSTEPEAYTQFTIGLPRAGEGL